MSIREVAARAGVSAATVSRVFTQPEAVAQGTRRRVLEIADELNYTPHPVARSLARGSTGNLGIVVPDLANPYSAMIAKVAQQEARAHGYALFVAGTDELAHDEEQWARAMVPQVDGLLLASPAMPDPALRALAQLGPLVLLNRPLPGIPAVLTDALEGAEQAVAHLHALGHRRLCYLVGPDSYSNDRRRDGYRAACARLDVEPVELGPFRARFAAGVQAADQLIAARVTGVLAFNDDIAVGVVNRLADRGLRVPDDMSVIGVDDTMLAAMVTPRLTTVRLPVAAAGEAATRLLLELLRGRKLPPEPVPLRGELIVRDSTGPVPVGNGAAT